MKLSPRAKFCSRSAPKAKPASGTKPLDRAFQRAQRHRHRRQRRIFITQGHTPGAGKGDPRVLKFDKNGNSSRPGEAKAPIPASST